MTTLFVIKIIVVAKFKNKLNLLLRQESFQLSQKLKATSCSAIILLLQLSLKIKILQPLNPQKTHNTGQSKKYQKKVKIKNLKNEIYQNIFKKFDFIRKIDFKKSYLKK